MGYFEDIQNPWSPGGQMSPRMPWAQPGLNYGWGHGNEFFHPKTKEQIQEEALMQLAVLAVVLVAPALVGAGGGAGAGGSLGSGAGTAGGSLGSGGGIGSSVGAGMGTSAEAAGGMLTQAEAVSGLVDSTLMAAPMVPAAGAGAGAGAGVAGTSLLGGLGVAAILEPFLQPDSMQILQQSAMMGEAHLNSTLHQLDWSVQQVELEHQQGLQSPKWRPAVERINPRTPSMRDTSKLHNAVPMILGVAKEIGKSLGMQQAIRKALLQNPCNPIISGDLSVLLQKIMKEQIALFENIWKSNNLFESNSFSIQQDPIREAIEKGLKSPRFRSLWDENEFDLNNYSEKFKIGTQTRYWSGTDDYIEIHIRGNGYDILAITHELTNRKYSRVLDALDDSVSKGEISFDDYSHGIIGIELNGIVNKIVVASELKIPYESVQRLVDYYGNGSISENEVVNYIREAIENAIIKDTGLPALEHYKLMGERIRTRFLRENGN